MDTSETYIKMCEKAEEIQSIRKCSGIFNGYNQIIQGIVYSDNDVLFQEGERFLSKRIVWLPRQGQLQEMIPCIQDKDSHLISRLLDTILDDYYKMEKYKSWEQFWLGFVMKEKYNKVWDGEQWK